MEPLSAIRNNPSKKFEANGYAPSSATSIATKLVILYQMILSNTDSTDRSVTIKDGDGNVMFQNTISAGDLYIREIPQGWKFTNGVQINAAAASVVRYELLGWTMP